MAAEVGIAPGISFPRALTAIVLAHAALTIPFLGWTTLANIDEGRISEVAREMALSGDFITPRLGEVPFACYPPLQYWLQAASGSVFGWNEFAMRLPGALCGVGLVIVTGLATRRMAGERAGLLASAFLASTPGFLSHEAACRADVTTTFFATSAFERFLAWAGAEEKDRRRRDLALMYVLVSLGTLAKGPIAIAMLGLGGLAWFITHGPWSLLLRMGFAWGIPLAAAIILPWYGLVYRSAGAAFLEENLLLENVNAFTRGYQQKRPWYFYFKVAPAAMIPWLPALGFAWNVRRARGLRFALAWMAAVFLFLTLSSAKRQSYLVYLDAPLAMAAGVIIAGMLKDAPRPLRTSLMGFGGTLAAGGAALLLIPSSTWTSDSIRSLADLFPLLAALLAAAGAALAAIAWKKGAPAGIAAVAALFAAGYVLHRAAIEPRWDLAGREMKAFCRRAAAAVPPGERIAYLATAQIDGAVHFYIGRPLQPRNGEPGPYILSPWQPAELENRGLRLLLLDSTRDARNRPTYLARVIE